jgi:hypothetical protein
VSIDPASGVISGTPTASGTFNVQAIATGANGQEDYALFSWIVRAAPTLPNQGTLTTAGGTAISPRQFTVSNGTAPYTWSFTGIPTAAWPNGTPPGIAMDAVTTTATITGTPVVAGSNTVTVTVRDAHGVTASRPFTWTVPALAVNTFTVPNTKIGTPIVPVTVTAAGGVSPYVSWSATNLPTGLSINPANGTISGTPTGVPKTYTNVVITVTDSSADTAARTAIRTIASWQAKL